MKGEAPPFVKGNLVVIVNDDFENLNFICESVNLLGIKLPIKDKSYTVRKCVDLGFTYGILLDEIVNTPRKFGDKTLEPMFIYDRFEKYN